LIGVVISEYRINGGHVVVSVVLIGLNEAPVNGDVEMEVPSKRRFWVAAKVIPDKELDVDR
jgi:hypothetical protein